MPGMDGFISFNGTLNGSIEGGGGGDVTDVKVRDSQESTFESVVDEEGVAEIDLISYVRRNELTQAIENVENSIDNVEQLVDTKQNIINYSTEEQNMGVKWIDGKPLYQKTFVQQLSGSTGQIDLSSYNIESAFIVDGYYDIGVTKLALNEFLNGSSYAWTHINTGTNPPCIDCLNGISQNSTIYITIRYTKTTD